MKQIKSLMLALALVVVASAINTTMAQPKSAAKFKVVNYSSWTIQNIYFSPTWDGNWGPDQLGQYTLEPNYEYSMNLASGCDSYDVKLIDEVGDECVVYDVYLCNDTWEIQDEDLYDCQGY